MQEFPHHILFFDGECALCNRCVRFARRHDRRGELHFAPIGGTTWDAYRSTVDSEDDPNTVHLVVDGREYRKSAAIVRMLLGCDGAWPILGAMAWIIPSPLRDLGYTCVARLRYRLFGSVDRCELDAEEDDPCMLP